MARTGSTFAFRFFGLFVGAMLFFGLLPKYAVAACNWGTGAHLGVESAANMTDVTLDLATFKMMSFRFWSDDSRFPVGSLMGLETVTLNGMFCTGLSELKGSRLDVVYEPPINATRHGSGYLIPSTAVGVALAVEFLSGRAHPGGMFLGSSVGMVTSGGLVLGDAGLPPLMIRLTLIKTGSFTAAPDSAASVIDFPGGIGRFKYYATDNPSVVSLVDNRLRMAHSLTAATNAGLTATAHAPVCEILKIGDVAFGGVNAGKTNIKLTSVSANDFTAIGALDNAARTMQFRFRCAGTTNTKASVTFAATFPYNSGVDGVGMPAVDSDVGVQILFHNSPITLGVKSSTLTWNARTYKESGLTKSDLRYGAFDPQGLYCVKDCGNDMTNKNWVDGGAAKGDNENIEAPLTFKYYQTTTKRPSPQTFSVPFTVTLNVD